MEFSQWCLRVILIAFAVFGCTGFYSSRSLTIKRSFACRVHGFILLLLFFSYYCYYFNDTKEFFLKFKGNINLIYFEFCLYWFVSLVAFAVTIVNGEKVAVWFTRVMNILSGFKSEDTTVLITAVTLNTAVLVVILPVYSYTSTTSRNQPNSSVVSALLYLALCGVCAVIILEIMMGKSFLAFLLRHLSLELARTLRRDALFYGAGFREYNRVKHVKEFMRRHRELFTLNAEFNNLFTVQVLLFTLLSFVELTYSTYYLISIGRLDSLFISKKLGFFFSVSYFLFYFVQFLQYNIMYELVQDEFQKIKDALNSALSEIEDEDILQNTIEIFLLQCGNLTENAKATGFFKVGHVLLGRMIQLITSALIILIQFEQFSPNFNAQLEGNSRF